MTLSRRTVGEAGLLTGLLAVVMLGSFAAQQRQVPPAAAIDALAVVLLVVAVSLVAVRRRGPRTVFAGTVATAAVYLGLGYPYGPVALPASVAVFALAGGATTTTGTAAVLGATGLWTGVVAPGVVGMEGWGALTAVAAGFAAWLIVPAWWAMARARRRDAMSAALERRRRAADEERLGLAREVHDVLAHNLTIIGVQSAAALRVFDRDPEKARVAVETVLQTNRRALAELRETIDLLRGSGPRDDDRAAPAGGLAELAGLAVSTRGAGTTVRLQTDVTAETAVAPSVERAAYRIVQESLTNVLRHAPGSSVTVSVARESETGALLVRIVDDGPGLREATGGRGIDGMRERAAAVGGALTVTSLDQGGVAVCARLPTGRDGVR